MGLNVEHATTRQSPRCCEYLSHAHSYMHHLSSKAFTSCDGLLKKGVLNKCYHNCDVELLLELAFSSHFVVQDTRKWTLSIEDRIAKPCDETS